MNKRIYKYELKPVSPQVVMMPFGAEPLHVAAVDDTLFLWAKVDPEQPEVPRQFFVYGTGHEIRHEDEERLEYISTALMFGGSLIWHVFEGRLYD